MMLLTNGLTDNAEFVGPFHSRVQFKTIRQQLLLFVYVSLEPDSYFQFSYMHYEFRQMVARRGAAEYRLLHISESQR